MKRICSLGFLAIKSLALDLYEIVATENCRPKCNYTTGRCYGFCGNAMGLHFCQFNYSKKIRKFFEELMKGGWCCNGDYAAFPWCQIGMSKKIKKVLPNVDHHICVRKRNLGWKTSRKKTLGKTFRNRTGRMRKKARAVKPSSVAKLWSATTKW